MSHTFYSSVRQRLQRSELAVPGSSPGIFEKALKSEADYVFLDLEDAVAPPDKNQARKKNITEEDKQLYTVVTQALKVILNASYGVMGAEIFPLYFLHSGFELVRRFRISFAWNSIFSFC